MGEELAAAAALRHRLVLRDHLDDRARVGEVLAEVDECRPRLATVGIHQGLPLLRGGTLTSG